MDLFPRRFIQIFPGEVDDFYRTTEPTFLLLFVVVLVVCFFCCLFQIHVSNLSQSGTFHEWNHLEEILFMSPRDFNSLLLTGCFGKIEDLLLGYLFSIATSDDVSNSIYSVHYACQSSQLVDYKI